MPTKIEWTTETWNPITGCTPISMGCEHCYARRAAYSGRLRGRFGYPQEKPFGITRHLDRLTKPFRWKKPRRIFVCSMGDLMHKDVPDAWIQVTIGTMTYTSQHTYQILTKRPKRLLDFAWPSNCWVGVTVEHPDYLDRIDVLRKVRAPIRFVSFEPLLAEMPELDLSGIGWVIVGAETGPGKRPMDSRWVRPIRDACVHYSHIPFFFKRDGSGLRLLEGHRWEEMPNVLTPDPQFPSGGKV